MKLLIIVLLLFPLAALSQHNRQRVFEQSAPPYEVGRAMLPGLLGILSGSVKTDTQKGRIVQQAAIVSVGISIGCWKKSSRKQILLRLGCGIAGFALGTILKKG